MPIGNVKQNATEAHNLVKERFLEANRRALKEKFATLFLEALQGSETASDPGSFYKSGFDLSTLSDKSDLDQQDENGNTNLIMACKFGRTTTVKWLTDHGVNKSSVDNVGCAALHWLFMFPEEDIDDISTRLSDRTDNVILPPGVTDSVYVAPFSVNHVALAPRPFSIDPQLPVYLAGTPLAFAVAVYCKQAVEAFILHLNADPLIGIYPWKQNMQNYSALHVAARLHMADILDFLLLHILVRKNSLPKSDIVYILNGLRDCMATATSIERTIIHGPHTVEAAEATVCTLQKYYDYVHERARTWKFLEPAIRKADLEVCSAILHAESAASDRPEQLFFESELVELMLACTSSACGIGPDTVLATRILEFATNVGASVDSMNDVPNITPHPPVFLVIEHHQSLLLDWFIEKQKVNLNVTDANGDTPLHAMITSGFSSTYGLAKLIQNGADPRLRNKKHLLPIQLALNDQMVNELITLLPFSDDFETQQLLEQAMSSNLPKAVTAIIQYAQGHHSQLELNLQSALSTAAVASSTRVTEALIAGGADPRKPDTDGISALHQAATFGNVDALLALIEGGADVNQRSYSAQANSAPISWSALVCSILCLVRPRQGADPVGARACCEELIKHGADVNCIDATGTTPLSYLLSLQSQDRNLELVECFLERGAQPGGPHAEPVLINAIIGHDYELAALLLKYKIGLMDIHNGMSVLHHCADIRLPEDITVKKGKFLPLFTFTQSLISAGCDLFKTDLWSRTPLDVAVQSKNGPLTFLLIDTLRETGNLQRKDLLPDPEEAAFIASLEHGKGNSRSRLISRFPKSSKPVDTPQTVNRPPTREASALIKAWRQAVLFKGLSTICAFIQADVHGPTTLLNRASCLSVLCYALEHEIGEIIIKFLGSLTRNPDATPDPYLSTIWQSIRPYLQATQFEALRKHNIFSRRRKNAISMADDAEIPSRLVTFASRLRYLDAIDGYSSLLPLEWLQSQGFYEAQRFSDFKECVISDSEAFSTWNTSTMQLPSILIFDDFEFGAGTVESENADISSSGLTRQLQLLQTLGTFGESHGVDSNYRRYDELYPHDTFKEVVSIEILYQEEEKDPVKLAEWEQVQNVLGTLGVFGETWQNGQCFKSGRIWVHQQLSFRYETAGMRQ
ncbi:ankyrin [Delitschia confertaspora ATCC 74209]|uniref:Ankyrin n=1 Tax=Delitschia confertaspora ATCC 74209 TaxID=1513339 RepID=A0A9P4MZL7_9PLEO|nr:ankyrin [Delitschia confertaspora ATCC 74209]